MIKAGAKRAVERRQEIPPFTIEAPFRLGHPPRPGVPPEKLEEGEDFRDLVKQILLRGYHYDLQEEEIWPMEPGNRVPALHKSLLKKWEEENARK